MTSPSPPPDPIIISISVLLPCYNTAGRFLRTAVESIINQSVNVRVEILLIDDGSTNNDTLQTLAHYEQQHPNTVCVIRRPQHEGIVAALQYGCTIARGQYIARMDADDWCAPDRLQTQLDYLVAHPHVHVVGCLVDIITWRHQGHEDGDDTTDYLTLSDNDDGTTMKRSPDLPTVPELVAWNMLFYCTLVHPSVMWRSQRNDDVVGVLPSYEADEYANCEDYSRWMRAVVGGQCRLANIPNVRLMRLRRHDGTNVSALHAQEQLHNTWRCAYHHLCALGICDDSNNDDSGLLLLLEFMRTLYRPGENVNSQQYERAINVIEQWTAFIVRQYGEAEEMKRVYQAATDRIGEIATLALVNNLSNSSAIYARYLTYATRTCTQIK